uniref:Zinc finger MYM-type protein 6 n=2 Tax=Anthurium amnicola TaxID=1678845 RepID=A0A1D1ZEF5_9ARAE
MVRKRSGAVGLGSKQGPMSDYPPLPSPSAKCNKPTPSSLFPSPRLFLGSFTGKGFSDSEAVVSPTSILETKHFSATGVSFSDRNSRKPPVDATVHPSLENKHCHWENGELRGVGLGIVDALNDENNQKLPKVESRKVFFGSQLKIQIPPLFPNSISPTSSVESANSPIEFGIKTKNSLLGSLSPSWRSPSGSGNLAEASSPRVFPGSLSMSEMELLEDYTCVITHGPNPRTTHIFDNYIVESCGDGSSLSTKENRFLPDQPGYPSVGFLSFCHACKKNLGQGKDTYMYRGDKAFCSQECRYQEMLFDEGTVACSEPTNDL